MPSPRFDSDHEKWDWLRSRPARDAEDRSVRELAALLWRASRHRPRSFAHLAHAYARDVVSYQTDTARVGGEDLGHPAGVVRRGVDDCDGKARLFCALCIAVGLEARLVPLWLDEGRYLKHVYAEVSLDDKWTPVETILRRARVGETYKAVPKESGSAKWLQ